MKSTITYLKVECTGCSFEERIAAEQIAPDQYRLIENPIQDCDFNFGTTVSVSVDSHGELSCTSIASPSRYTTRKFIRTSGMNSKELYLNICQPIAEAGGYWQNGCAGISFVHLPHATSLCLESLFEQHNYHPLEITGQ